jgi:hypothetical protein
MSKEIHHTFEAVKLGATQNAGGWVLRLSVHPHDMSGELSVLPAGTRFMVVMVEMPDNDDEARKQEGERAVMMAGMFCKERNFWRFLSSKYEHDDIGPIRNENACARLLKEVLGVRSRADIRDDPPALKKFIQLRDEYHEFVENI